MSVTKSSGTSSAFRTQQPAPFNLTGIDMSMDEFHELIAFNEFLADHVQPDRTCDVQCMLLWNEWVRTFRRRTRGFPILIREKEFRNIITDVFGAEIAHDNFRGPLYPGIRYVP